MERKQVLDVVRSHVLEIVEDLDATDFDPTRPLTDLGANSLDIVEIVSCAMRELRVRVPRTELAKLENVDGLVDLLHPGRFRERSGGLGVSGASGARVVLITGGTMGIGLETGLAFAAQGAQCVLTYKWGTADEVMVRRRYDEVGDLPPDVVRADAADAADTEALLDHLAERYPSVEVFVSNVSASLMVQGPQDYSLRALTRTLEYSTWPLIAYSSGIRERLGRYPRYIVGLSSTAVADSYAVGYDFMAAAKAVLETLCRYLNYHLFEEDVRINVVRSHLVSTESLRQSFGEEFENFAARYIHPRHVIKPREVAEAIVALASGLLDGVSGQVLTVDRGTSFFDNLMRLYEEREDLGL